MALIPCYECEKEISDKALACPHCGAPKEEQPSELEEPTLSTQEHSKSSQEEAVDPNETISGLELLMRLSQKDRDKLISSLRKGELPIDRGSKTQQKPSPASEKPPSSE